MGEFKNKTIIVTGSTSGIGEATALEFAKQGANIVVTGRREDIGKKVVEHIKDLGGEACFYKLDVSNESQVAGSVEFATSKYGQLDYAFNNAGIGGKLGDLTSLSEDDWDNVMNINLKGVWFCIKHQISQMRKQSSGYYSIVNMSSLWGLGASDMGVSPYVASKHAVIGLTKAAALENAKLGIRVNSICPAWVPSEANAHIVNNPEQRAQLEAYHPVGRLGTKEEIAKTVIFLCSSGSGFITGQSIVADGGVSSRL